LRDEQLLIDGADLLLLGLNQILNVEHIFFALLAGANSQWEGVGG